MQAAGTEVKNPKERSENTRSRRYVIRFPGSRDVIEVTSWNEVEDAIKSKGYDPSKAKVHDHTNAKEPSSSRKSTEAAKETPSTLTRESPISPSIRDKPLGRTDYLMKDKLVPQSSVNKDSLRMQTSYDLMSRELWRMTQQGENPFDTTR